MTASPETVTTGYVPATAPTVSRRTPLPEIEPEPSGYRSIRHPRRGSKIDITDPDSPSKVEQQLRESGNYLDFTWTLVVNGIDGHRSRLLVRTRGNYGPQTPALLFTPLGLFDATYGVAMLRAIARRVESSSLRP